MFVIKYSTFLLFITSLSGNDVSGHQPSSVHRSNITISSSPMPSLTANASLVVMPNNYATSSITVQDKPYVFEEEESVFENNYDDRFAQNSNTSRNELCCTPDFKTTWTFVDKETINMTFQLFSIFKSSQSSNATKPSNVYDDKINAFPNLFSISSRSTKSIRQLKHFLFVIGQNKTNFRIVRNISVLNVKSSIGKRLYFSNSIILIRLNPKEIYTVCIYYYQKNISTQSPDLLICQDIMHNNPKHSAYGLLFVVTQYSIILGILILLQGLFSMRKRRLAHIVHQHLVSKAQRLRLTLSSVSLIRQSVSVTEETKVTQQDNAVNGYVPHEKNKLKKRIISSPAIVLTEPPVVPLNKTVDTSDENEPFIKLTNGKNHVHFLLGLDEESENEDADDDNNKNEDDTMINGASAKPPFLSVHSEPYGDQSDAVLSMAHILDSNKPWLRYSQDTIP